MMEFTVIPRVVVRVVSFLQIAILVFVERKTAVENLGLIILPACYVIESVGRLVVDSPRFPEAYDKGIGHLIIGLAWITAFAYGVSTMGVFAYHCYFG